MAEADFLLGGADVGGHGDLIDAAAFGMLPGPVRVALAVLDYDDLRGALLRDGRGRSDRGDLAALRSLEAAG